MISLSFSSPPVDEAEYRGVVALLRAAGCKDVQPLLGYRPGVGPRCRLCNTVAVEPQIATAKTSDISEVLEPF